MDQPTDSKRSEYELPQIEGEFLTSLTYDGGVLTLHLTADAKTPRRSQIAFHKVRAFRHHAEVHSTLFHVEAYDVLVEVENSSWAAEVRQRTSAPWDTYWSLRHYLIYVDSDGSYEVLAEGYTVRDVV